MRWAYSVVMCGTVAQKGVESEQLFCSVALNHASAPECSYRCRSLPGLCCVVSAGQVDARWRNLANRGWLFWLFTGGSGGVVPVLVRVCQ